MSQPKMTSQKPKPDFIALFSLSIDTYLPRSTPSTSKAPIFALVMPRSSRLFSNWSCSDIGRSLERDPDGLGLGVKLEGARSHLSPPTRLLHPSERGRAVEAVPH